MTLKTEDKMLEADLNLQRSMTIHYKTEKMLALYHKLHIFTSKQFKFKLLLIHLLEINMLILHVSKFLYYRMLNNY